jgi:hypothetical protein
MMSKKFDFFNHWVIENTQHVFYKGLQTYGSPDHIYYSLDLLFRRDSVFQFGNSGLSLSVRSDSSIIVAPDIRIEQKFRILTYINRFDPDSYNPKDLKRKFLLALSSYNISEESAMASFLYDYVEVNKKSTATALLQLKKDLLEQKKINLEFDETEHMDDKELRQKLVQQIHEQSNRYSSEILYELYIQPARPAIRKKKIDAFFSSYASGSVSETIAGLLAYNMDLHFTNKAISVDIAQKYLPFLSRKMESSFRNRDHSLYIRNVSV